MKALFAQILVKLIYLTQGIVAKNDKACPYCSTHSAEVACRKYGIVDICHCANCSLYWTNPIFKLPKFYGSLYSAEGLTTASLRKDELEQLKATCFKNTDKDYSQILDWLRKVSPGKELLEFGSSWGYFLFQAKAAGFDVKGVEISDNRRKFGIENLEVDIRPTVSALLPEQDRFDVIYTAHVLEHLTRLDEIFNHFHALLHEDGLLIVEVPHLNLARGREVFGIMGAVHPLGFVKDFFEKNLPRHGFEVAVHLGYGDLIEGYDDKGDNLVVICRKTPRRVSL